MEIYNPSDREIDLEGYQIYYYYDPALPFDKSKSNRWTITKDRYSTDTLIRPNETKVIWIKKRPCCYDLSMEQFLTNYNTDGKGLSPSQLLAVFTPGNNQGLNGTSTSGRSLSISAPSGTHLIGIRFNNGRLDAGVNESITYRGRAADEHDAEKRDPPGPFSVNRKIKSPLDRWIPQLRGLAYRSM